MTKSVWDDADEVEKISAVIDKIKRGVAAWQKPWKPGEHLKPIGFDLSFYQARAKRPEPDPETEATDG